MHISSYTMGKLTFASLLTFILFSDVALSHDPNNPKLNQWFDSLKSGNGPCCSDADGTALSDVDWESKDGKYRVQIKGQWYDVPDSAVLDGPNMDGRTIVWPMYSMGNMHIRCFIPGSMT